MPRRGHSATIGKFAKFYQDRRASEIRVLGELLRREQLGAALTEKPCAEATRDCPAPH